MLREHLLVFDEQLPTQSSYFSKADFYKALGQYDQIALHAIVDNPTGATNGTITVVLEHSCDGRNFIAKNATAEINAAAIAFNSQSDAAGGDGGALPTLEYGRLNVKLAGGVTAARVRIWATLRDTGV